jgi:hypothetical protein
MATATSTNTGHSTQTNDPVNGGNNHTPVPTTTSVNCGIIEPATPLRDRAFLLMCANTAKFRTELAHIETTYVGNDQILFANIKAKYEELRGSPLRFFSLFIPSSIHLIKVH